MVRLTASIWMVSILPLVVLGESVTGSDKCTCCSAPQGPAGVPGIHGVPGQSGRRGEKGDSGSIGEPGNMGVKGEKGEHGTKGSRGKRGKKGECGEKGETGNKGNKGDRGYNGYKGERGHQGDPAKPMPKVAFSVGRNKKLGPVPQEVPVTFDSVFTNIGESFDEYTSHFICKIQGAYYFTVHILGQLNENAFAWIMKNNQHIVPLHGDKRAGYGTGANSVILSLVADDHVWVRLENGSALLNHYCTFSGYLIFYT